LSFHTSPPGSTQGRARPKYRDARLDPRNGSSTGDDLLDGEHRELVLGVLGLDVPDNAQVRLVARGK